MAFKMKGSPAKLGTISGTAGHASALKQVEDKKKKGFFERLTGKKFKETNLGKDLQRKKEDIQSLKEKGLKKHIVTRHAEKQLETKKDANVLGTNKTLQVHKSSSGSGAIKPSGKNKEYKAIGSKGYTFTRGGGDPYQYRTSDEGQTFQYKKVGEKDWSDVKGGKDKISSSYTASMNKMKGSPVQHTRSRGNHMEKWGKDHTNADHPNYWRKPRGNEQGMSQKQYDQLSDIAIKERKKGLDSLEKAQKSASDK
jgi:glucose dehydrogenase